MADAVTLFRKQPDASNITRARTSLSQIDDGATILDIVPVSEQENGDAVMGNVA